MNCIWIIDIQGKSCDYEGCPRFHILLSFVFIFSDIDPYKMFVSGVSNKTTMDDLRRMFPNAIEIWLRNDNAE